MKDVHIEDFHKPKTCLHTFLFGSEFVSVDDIGNVLVFSLPQLPLESNSKQIEGSNMASVHHLVHDYKDHEENPVQAKGNPSSHPRSLEVENLHESSLCNPDAENGKLFSGAEEILHTPVSSRMRKEMDISGQDHNVVHDRMLIPSAHESSNDFRDSELSPRLTNFIKSGIVPESPVNNSGLCLQTLLVDIPGVHVSIPMLMSAILNTGTWNADVGDFTGPAFVSSQNMQPEFFMNSWKHDEKELKDASSGKMDVPCSSDDGIQTLVLHCNDNALGACSSPIPVATEMQAPFAKISNTSSSKDWLLDSGVKPETVEQQCKFRRLRKHGDLNRKIPTESRERTGPSRKLRTSRGTDYHTSTKRVKGYLISFYP